MGITIVKGDATDIMHLSIPCVIAHICNDQRKWGRGFVLSVSRRWPGVRDRYLDYRKLKLGNVQFIEVERHVWVANMIAQHGLYALDSDTPPIRYDALYECLKKLNRKASIIRTELKLPVMVSMPKIGTGLAGGNWEFICHLIKTTLHGIRVRVHILEK